MVTIHPAAHKINLHSDDWNHIASGRMSKISKEAQNEIAAAIASTMDSDNRSLDIKDVVAVAKKKSLLQLESGLANLLKGRGVDRNPEGQRKIDMNTDFFRKPKTYRGQHPDHRLIVKYFDHYSRALPEDARATVMHDANLGEYGSAQRKLARRHDRLPAGLDGLKFGDYQIETIKMMAEDGVFKSFFFKARRGDDEDYGGESGWYGDETDSDGGLNPIDEGEEGDNGKKKQIWETEDFRSKVEAETGYSNKAAAKAYWQKLVQDNPEEARTILQFAQQMTEFGGEKFQTPSGWVKTANADGKPAFFTQEEHSSRQKAKQEETEALSSIDDISENPEDFGVEVGRDTSRIQREASDDSAVGGEGIDYLATNAEDENAQPTRRQQSEVQYRTVGNPSSSLSREDLDSYKMPGQKTILSDQEQKNMAQKVATQSDGTVDDFTYYAALRNMGWTEEEFEAGKRNLGHSEETVDELIDRMEKLGIEIGSPEFEKRVASEGWTRDEIESGQRTSAFDEKTIAPGDTRLDRFKYVFSRPIKTDGADRYLVDEGRPTLGALRDENGEWTPAARVLAKVMFPNLLVNSEIQLHGSTEERPFINPRGMFHEEHGVESRDGVNRYHFFRDHLSKQGTINADKRAPISIWRKALESILNRPLTSQDMMQIDELADYSKAHAEYKGWEHEFGGEDEKTPPVRKKVAGDANAFERLNWQRQKIAEQQQITAEKQRQETILQQFLDDYFPPVPQANATFYQGDTDGKQDLTEEQIQERQEKIGQDLLDKNYDGIVEQRRKIILDNPSLWDALGIDFHPTTGRPNERKIDEIARQRPSQDRKVAQKLFEQQTGQPFGVISRPTAAISRPEYSPRKNDGGFYSIHDDPNHPMFDETHKLFEEGVGRIDRSVPGDVVNPDTGEVIVPGSAMYHRLRAEGWTPQEIQERRRGSEPLKPLTPEEDAEEFEKLYTDAEEQGITGDERELVKYFRDRGWTPEEASIGSRDFTNVDHDETFHEASKRLRGLKFFRDIDGKRPESGGDPAKAWQESTHVTPNTITVGPEAHSYQNMYEQSLLTDHSDLLRRIMYDGAIIGQNSKFARQATIGPNGKELRGTALKRYLAPLIGDILEHLDKTNGEGVIGQYLSGDTKSKFRQLSTGARPGFGGWRNLSAKEKEALAMKEVTTLANRMRGLVFAQADESQMRQGAYALASREKDNSVKNIASREIQKILETRSGVKDTDLSKQMKTALDNGDIDKLKELLVSKNPDTGMPLIRDNRTIKDLYKHIKTFEHGRTGLELDDPEQLLSGTVPMTKRQFQAWANDDLNRLGGVFSRQSLSDAQQTLSQLGYDQNQITRILAYVKQNGTSDGAHQVGLHPDDHGIFDGSVLDSVLKKYLYKTDPNGNILTTTENGKIIPVPRYTKKDLENAGIVERKNEISAAEEKEGTLDALKWAQTYKKYHATIGEIAKWQRILANAEDGDDKEFEEERKIAQGKMWDSAKSDEDYRRLLKISGVENPEKFKEYVKNSILTKLRKSEIESMWNSLLSENDSEASRLWRGIIRSGVSFNPRRFEKDSKTRDLLGQEGLTSHDSVAMDIFDHLASKGGVPVRKVIAADPKSGRQIVRYEDYFDPQIELTKDGEKKSSFIHDVSAAMSANKDLHGLAKENLHKILSGNHPVVRSIQQSATGIGGFITFQKEGDKTFAVVNKVKTDNPRRILSELKSAIEQLNTIKERVGNLDTVNNNKFQAMIDMFNKIRSELDISKTGEKLTTVAHQDIMDKLLENQESSKKFIDLATNKDAKSAIKSLYVSEDGGKLAVTPWEDRSLSAISGEGKWTAEDDAKFEKWYQNLSPEEIQRQRNSALWNLLEGQHAARIAKDFAGNTDLHGDPVIDKETGEVTKPALAKRVDEYRDRREGRLSASQEKEEAASGAARLGAFSRQRTQDPAKMLADILSSSEGEETGSSSGPTEMGGGGGQASVWATAAKLGGSHYERLITALQGLTMRPRGSIRELIDAVQRRTGQDPKTLTIPHGRLTVAGHEGNEKIIQQLIGKKYGSGNNTKIIDRKLAEELASKIDADYVIAHPGNTEDGISDRSLLLSHILHSLSELSSHGESIYDVTKDGRKTYSGTGAGAKTLSYGMTKATAGAVTGNYGRMMEGMKELLGKGSDFSHQSPDWPKTADGSAVTVAGLVRGKLHPEIQRAYDEFKTSSTNKNLTDGTGKIITDANGQPLAHNPHNFVLYRILPILRKLHAQGAAGGDSHAPGPLDPSLTRGVNTTFETLDQKRKELHDTFGTTPDEIYARLSPGGTAATHAHRVAFDTQRGTVKPEDRARAMQAAVQAFTPSSPATSATPKSAAPPVVATPITGIQRTGAAVAQPPAPSRTPSPAPSSPAPSEPATPQSSGPTPEVKEAAGAALRPQAGPETAAKSFTAFAPKPFPFSWRTGA